MRLVLALEVLEDDEERFGLLDRQAVRAEPGHERALLGHLLGTLPDMPPDHF